MKQSDPGQPPWRQLRTQCSVCGKPLRPTLRRTCGPACVAERLKRNGGIRTRDPETAREDSELVNEHYRRAFGAAAAYHDIILRSPLNPGAGGRFSRPVDIHTRPVSRDWRRTAV